MGTAVIILVGISGLTYFVIVYNGLVTIKNNVDKSWSNIDVLLKQRYDELPNLVAVCERYMNHEAETLERVIGARALMSGAASVNHKSMAEGMLTEALKSLFAVTENYPELKADKTFAMLQARITDIENEIADRRELYNESVNIYNSRIESLPDCYIAGFMNYRAKDLWKINYTERKAPKVTFSQAS